MAAKSKTIARRAVAVADYEVWAIAEGVPPECLAGPTTKARAEAIVGAIASNDLRLEIRRGRGDRVVLTKAQRGRVRSAIQTASRFHAAVAGTYRRGVETPPTNGVLTQLLIEKLAGSPRVERLVGDVLGEMTRLLGDLVREEKHDGR